MEVKYYLDEGGLRKSPLPLHVVIQPPDCTWMDVILNPCEYGECREQDPDDGCTRGCGGLGSGNGIGMGERYWFVDYTKAGTIDYSKDEQLQEELSYSGSDIF